MTMVYNYSRGNISKNLSKKEKSIKRRFSLTLSSVHFHHTLVYDEKGDPSYPSDKWIGFRKHLCNNPMVEVKTAELASLSSYREVTRMLKEWTAFQPSHRLLEKW